MNAPGMELKVEQDLVDTSEQLVVAGLSAEELDLVGGGTACTNGL